MEKPDWKQWLPVGGLILAIRGQNRGLPSVLDEYYKLGNLAALYHAVTTASVIAGGTGATFYCGIKFTELLQ